MSQDKKYQANNRAANKPPIIWLLGLRPNPAKAATSLWGKFRLWLLRLIAFRWPGLLGQKIGRLPQGESETAVHLLELPYTKAEFRALPARQRRLWLSQALDWLSRPQNRALKIGMPLALHILMAKQFAQSRPPLLADPWQLTAQEFVRQMSARLGGPESLRGKQVAVLGVENACPAERLLCNELLAAGSRPVLYGAHALGLADYYYQKYGIALPVFGARKAIRSSSVILVLNGLPGAAAEAQQNGPRSKAVFYFREPHVSVAGQFSERFSFGSFPAGQASALLNCPHNS